MRGERCERGREEERKGKRAEREGKSCNGFYKDFRKCSA